MNPNGRLIVLEGVDYVGKSTLANALTSKLVNTGHKAECLAFPGNEPSTLGSLVYRLHHETHSFGIENMADLALQTLHVAAHVDSIQRIILPRLHAGCDVVLDRYWWSTYAYGRSRGVDEKLLIHLIDYERLVWGNIAPHVVVVLNRRSPKLTEPLCSELTLLRDAYDALAKVEGSKYRVEKVQNDSTVSNALSRIEELI